ncbi:hypothetical protein EBR96_01345 [bacterium]|nr:hypothetical protein [bacterium]
MSQIAFSEKVGIVLRPNFPFIKWIKSAVKGTEFEEDVMGIVAEKSQSEGHIYLLPTRDGIEEIDDLLKSGYRTIFENELMEWQIDPDLWPKELSYPLFQQWFTVAIHDLIFELS